MQYTTTEHPMVAQDDTRYKHLSNVSIVLQTDPVFFSRLNDFKSQMFAGGGIASRSNLGSGWVHYFTSQPYKRVDPHTGDELDWVAMDFQKP